MNDRMEQEGVERSRAAERGLFCSVVRAKEEGRVGKPKSNSPSKISD